jgi:hypothetical protein
MAWMLYTVVLDRHGDAATAVRRAPMACCPLAASTPDCALAIFPGTSARRCCCRRCGVEALLHPGWRPAGCDVGHVGVVHAAVAELAGRSAPAWPGCSPRRGRGLRRPSSWPRRPSPRAGARCSRRRPRAWPRPGSASLPAPALRRIPASRRGAPARARSSPARATGQSVRVRHRLARSFLAALRRVVAHRVGGDAVSTGWKVVL